MFCIPEFGVEVTTTLWDPSILHMLDHSSNISPVPYININRDFTGSSCSLFSGVSQQNLNQEKTDSPKEEEDPSETEEVNDHASPATIGKALSYSSSIEDLRTIEGGGFNSTFQITPKWLTTILHICKVHASFADRMIVIERIMNRYG